MVPDAILPGSSGASVKSDVCTPVSGVRSEKTMGTLDRLGFSL